jgi:predicted GNAT family N-acyltransferase
MNDWPTINTTVPPEPISYDLLEQAYHRVMKHSEPNLICVVLAKKTKAARRKLGRVVRRGIARKGEMGQMILRGKLRFFKV